MPNIGDPMSDDSTPSVNDGAEPSMEDILASIRRIIADDDNPETTDIEIAESEASVDIPLELVETSSNTIDDEGALETIFASDDENNVMETAIADNDSIQTSIVEDSNDDDILDLVTDNLIADDEESAFEVSNTAKIEEVELSAESEDDLDALLNEISADTFEDDPFALDMDEDLLQPSTSTGGDTVQSEVLKDVAKDSVNILEAEAATNLIDAPSVAEAASDAGEEFTIDDLESIFEDNDDDLIVEDIVIDPAANLLAEDASVLETSGLESQTNETLADELDLNPETETVSQSEEDDELELVSTGETDLDLVKSLMADLTDDSFLDDGDQDMTQAEPSTETAIDTAADIPSDSPSEADVMDDILDMTLDGETALIDSAPNEDELSDIFSEIEKSEAIAPQLTSDDGGVEAVTSSPSLKEIAEAARAQAETLQTEPEKPALGAGAALATGAVAVTAGLAAAQSGKETDDQSLEAMLDEMSDIEAAEPIEAAMPLDTDENPDMTNETIQDESKMETSEMPRAAKDAILDDVTESATASAFAQLNSVVEEKAIVAERGDRIGDLVQEALRPMLKEWLDANLKGIVERAVTKEVKRIASGK